MSIDVVLRICYTVPDKRNVLSIFEMKRVERLLEQLFNAFCFLHS